MYSNQNIEQHPTTLRLYSQVSMHLKISGWSTAYGMALGHRAR